MEIKKENLEKSKVKLTIKVSSPEMRSYFDRAYEKLAPTIVVKGFRPGTAPKSLTISAIGENRLNSEILDLALQETYAQALKKEGILPIAQPKVEIKVAKDLTVDTAELEYTVEVDVLPSVKVGDYKKITIKTKGQKDKEEVSNEEIEHVLSHLQRQKATFKDIATPLKEGDRAEINFEGLDKGVKLESLTSEHYPVILGSGSLIPEFEKKLIGLKKDDKKEFSLEMVDQKDPKAPKKKIDFKVEVLQTQEVILPSLDDKFAQDFDKKTLEELKKAIGEDVVKQKQEVAKRNLENQVLEELVKITEVEVPESLVTQEIDRQINGMRAQVASMGLTFEKYLETLKKSEDEFKNELRPQAQKTIKIGLALGEILKKEATNWKIDPKSQDAGKLVLEKLISYTNK